MKKRKRRSKKSFQLKLKRETMFSIAQISFFALAGLVIVSFARQGAVLIKLNEILLQYFGWATLFLPFTFISFGFLISKFKNPLGQPNVIIGSLIVFVSLSTLGKGGSMGALAWEGVSSLITSAGAFIVLFGTAVVGIVIMFNTSLDVLVKAALSFLTKIRGYLIGSSKLSIPRPASIQNKSLKIVGMNDNKEGPTNSKGKPAQKETKGELEQKLISNLPGEEKVWKYPPTNMLTGTGRGQADRGDINGNAEVIERTLDSFGVTAKVIEVSQGPAVTQYAIEVA